MAELNVDPALLTQAATGINTIISELSELGVGETGAVGRGFAQLTMSAMEAGTGNVQTCFETFAERWSWGVRALVQSGNEIAKILDLSAGRYFEMDEQFSNTFKQMFTHLAGNPHLSKADIENMDWGQVWDNSNFNTSRQPEYSAESFSDAFSHMGDNVSMLGQVGQYLASDEVPEQSGLGDMFLADTGAAAKAAEIQQAQQAARGGK
ncbi:hypothetical protein [Nocardia mangyaensis]|uniref:hypothetical protein n=1 Tax=Nocardia mangyaensis TaxID=2213200 RepID=UPI0026747DA3|nr:hypothetical protein [Nocardia mangyaensis]MDO3648957.1 hypothetical protein [Nocardia mangyaensis]